MEYIRRADADEIAAYGAVIRESFATVAREFGLTRESVVFISKTRKIS